MKRQNITKLQELPTEGSLTDRTRERNALGLIAFLLYFQIFDGFDCLSYQNWVLGRNCGHYKLILLLLFLVHCFSNQPVSVQFLKTPPTYPGTPSDRMSLKCKV